jgi:hypothetical protein
MKLLSAGICVFFLAFATLRATRVPLTYDEAASYIRYLDTTVPSVFDTTSLSIFNFEVATNHFLNTLLTKVSVAVAGDSELVLRVPNLIAYAMFMVFSVLILGRYVRPWIAAAGLLLLNLNPYVLDFFTVSRGYGLSIGFLMGAMFFLFRFLDRLKARQEAFRDASRTFAFALASVMSNFALLNVWLSVFGVAVFAFGLQNALVAKAGTQDHGSRLSTDVRRSWRSRALLLVIATAFAALVFSQDSRVSTSLYEPVTVRIAGLDEVQRDRVAVVGIDLLGRESRLPHPANGTEWRWPDRVPYRGLRIESPLADLARLDLVEVTIGDRVFSFDPRRDVRWSRSDRDSTASFEADSSISLRRSRVRQFQPVMNWAGDARYAASVAVAAACALGILAAFALVLEVVGRTFERFNVMRQEQWRPLESAALWVAALAGPPLYLLKRNSELYFGGTRGLVVDTFYSTIDSSFYGRTYHPAQVQIVFAGVLISIAVGGVVLYRNLHRDTSSVMLPATALLTILIVTSGSLVVQHVLFDTVYLTGRTALFFIPLYALLIVLLCEAIAAGGSIGRIFATVLVLVALSGATYHFTATANAKYAWDWRDDASTRMMMEDLQLVLDAEGRGGSHLVLGVDPGYIPVAVYYARRSRAHAIEVVALPSKRRVDFIYRSENAATPAIRRYPLTRTVLLQPGS